MTVAHSTVFQCQSFLPIFIKINRRICIMVARTAENNSPCSFSFVKPISNEFIMAQGITRYTTMIDRILLSEAFNICLLTRIKPSRIIIKKLTSFPSKIILICILITSFRSCIRIPFYKKRNIPQWVACQK